MDREVCVLVYSQYSTASKNLVDYIKLLPYDFAAVTGLTFLAADTLDVREKLTELGVVDVPAIFIKYFDGRTVIYTGQKLYGFVDSITSSLIVSQQPADQVNDQVIEEFRYIPPRVQPPKLQVQQKPVEQVTDSVGNGTRQPSAIRHSSIRIEPSTDILLLPDIDQTGDTNVPKAYIKRDDVMDTAAAMWKQREDSDVKSRPGAAVIVPPNKTTLKA